MADDATQKVALVLPFFHVGGVERWALNVRMALQRQGYDVRLVVLGAVTASSSDFGPALQPGVLSIERGMSAWMRTLWGRDRAQVVITGLSKLNFLLSLWGRLFGVPTLTSVHLSLGKKEHEMPLKYQARRWVHQRILSWSSRVICVSQGIANELAEIAPRHRTKVVTIYNPCFSEAEIVSRWPPTRSRAGLVRVVAAGRLHEQKGFDLLIDAVALLEPIQAAEMELLIFGEGAERRPLEQKLQSIPRRVLLKGVTGQLMAELRQADIFVLSSRYEGFGNVLAEALAAGCRCIAFDVPHGPREILADGQFGTLVTAGDTRALAAALGSAIAEFKLGTSSRVTAESDTARQRQAARFTTESFGRSVIGVLPQSLRTVDSRHAR